MDILEIKPSADKVKPEPAELEKAPALDAASTSAHRASAGAVDSASEEVAQASSEATDSQKATEQQTFTRRRKLYQSLARVEGALKVNGDDLVLITKGDKTELTVVQVVGKYTAVRLLKLPANQRKGLFSLYPQVQGVKITNFFVDGAQPDLTAPPLDQMFISGKLASKEEGAFFVDIGRNKRTKKARNLVEIPLRIEGKDADPRWQIGQWIGLVLHRQGDQWRWQGDTRPVLKSAGSITEAQKES